MTTQIAYLVAAHTDFDQLIRLCSRLVESGDVFVHIDKKVNQATYQTLLKKIGNYNLSGTNRIIFINNRISVFWAGFSQVKLQRLFLKTALESQEKIYSRFIFLSGLCYPIKSSLHIFKEFDSNKAKEYVCGMNLTEYDKEAQKVRYAGYHLFRDINIRPILLKKFLVAASIRILWRLRIRKPYRIKHKGSDKDIYFGGSWIGLTRECAEYVYSNLNETSCYWRYFKTSYACDELCIPTIIFNSKYRSNACLIDESQYKESANLFAALSPLHQLQYKGLIKVYTEKDYDELTESDRMFVRKVVSGQSDRLVEMLDASFLKQKI